MASAKRTSNEKTPKRAHRQIKGRDEIFIYAAGSEVTTGLIETFLKYADRETVEKELLKLSEERIRELRRIFVQMEAETEHSRKYK